MSDENKELKSTQELLGQGQSDLERRLSARELTEAPQAEVLLEQRRQAEIEDATNLAAQRESMGLATERESDIEKLETIQNTDGFDKAIKEGRTGEAEKWFLAVKDTKYAGNERWLRHRSETLYHLYRDAGDFIAAKRMIEILADGEAKDGRKRDLSLIAQKPYEQI